jgi:hypothetical protein
MNERRQALTSHPGILAGWFLLILVTSVSASSAQLTLRGTANPSISISTGTAGGTMTSVVNTSSTIRYTRQNNKICKITVSTSCPTQAFSLQVVATGVTRGVAMPAVALTNGMLAVDFITSIPGAAGWTTVTPTLQYTASATFAQGNSADLGNDVHTVTYTLQLQ